MTLALAMAGLLPVKEVPRVRQDLKGHRVFKAQLAVKVHKVTQAQQARRVQPDPQARALRVGLSSTTSRSQAAA
jgi:hypothetical protein